MIAGTIMIAALLLKYCYIFNFMAYRDSLKGDMAEYWFDSVRLAFSSQVYLTQWGGFAPFYKYFFLVPLLHWLNSVGSISSSIYFIVLSNIILYSLSSCVFYLMAERMIVNKILSLTALIFFSFSYLAVCVNALLLPDTLAISLTVMATGIIVLQVNRVSCFLGGLLLGIAVAAKPFLFVFSPVFIWYILSKSGKKDLAWKVIVFTVAMVIVPLLTVRENDLISHGKLKSLAAIGGSNFYQGWGKVGRIKTFSTEGKDSRYSPGALDEPKWGEITVYEPWYHQGYFYQLGLRSIVQDPGVLLEKLLWFKKLFWGVLGPSLRKNPPGFYKIIPFVENTSYLMFLSLGGLWIFNRRKACSIDVHMIFFLMAAFFMAIYAFGLPERRYFLNIEYLVILLFFVLVNRMLALYKVYQKEIFIYSFVVLTFFICVPLTLEQAGKFF